MVEPKHRERGKIGTVKEVKKYREHVLVDGLNLVRVAALLFFYSLLFSFYSFPLPTQEYDSQLVTLPAGKERNH